jgi:demethylmenaquinone methyltransferase/2-methoxy-6-polyprenyl-1,4-benzoquinol methylase/ArsR family transcriptional regulator
MIVAPEKKPPFDDVLLALAAAGEPTRLRLLALLSDAELTVSELVVILGQSQPRISRHLKLLVEAGLVERHREGAWVFLLVAQSGPAAGLARDIVGAIAANDPILAADKARLDEVRRSRADQAARYFATHAATWDKVRAMHIAEEAVEAAIRQAVGERPIGSLLDVGTGTGRMLELLAPHAGRALGIDQSPAMLGVARDRLERAGLRNTQLRQGDIFALPVERDGYDLVVLHQVLHYLDDPSRALREAARTVRPGGRLLVVDFAPHGEESLRADHAHRRLGFAREEIAGLMADAGLDVTLTRDLAPDGAGALTVSLWMGRDRRIQADPVPLSLREIA